ncbi:MAG TPA: hypothetical protein VMS92_21725 [Mycobacterium sp.]|nr:hypothetical protein [Mycobacterium sp.]
MTIRPATADELRYVHECALKTLRPDGVSWLSWQRHRRGIVERWTFTVIGDDTTVAGFVGQDVAGVRIQYVRKRFRGLGLGRLLSDAVKAAKLDGFGEWSDL